MTKHLKQSAITSCLTASVVLEYTVNHHYSYDLLTLRLRSHLSSVSARIARGEWSDIAALYQQDLNDLH